MRPVTHMRYTGEWQVIDTAPRDGTRILASGPQLKVAECEWRPAWHGDPEGWYRSNQHPRVEPTHWMPLPPPPDAEVVAVEQEYQRLVARSPER